MYLHVNGNNIPELDFMCTPCVNFGGFYCYDDPWAVNFNGDKCYENAVDRLSCDNFNFTNNVADCYGSILKEAKACQRDENNLMKRIFEEYSLPVEDM